MFRSLSTLAVPLVLLGLATSVAQAQRGTGQLSGVARQASEIDTVTLWGTVVKVESNPCESTTGRSPIGTHFFLKTGEDKTLNIHLGPAVQVEQVARGLPVGERVQVQAFRTQRMQADHYVAQWINVGDQTLRLRDDNLRPVWAGGRGMPARRRGARF
jgi:hypothetical protein